MDKNIEEFPSLIESYECSNDEALYMNDVMKQSFNMGKQMSTVFNDKESINGGDSSQLSTTRTLREQRNQTQISYDTFQNSVHLYGEREQQSSSSGLIEGKKPKNKKQKPQKFTLDQLFPVQATQQKRTTPASVNYKKQIEAKFQEISLHRQFFKERLPEKMSQLKQELRDLYKSHIEQQVITQMKDYIFLEFHRITEIDVKEVLEYCRKTILNLKNQIKPYFTVNKKCIHVQINTGEGEEQTIYKFVESILKKKTQQYYVQDHKNQGLVDMFVYT